jgi:hypothetical protein
MDITWMFEGSAEASALGLQPGVAQGARDYPTGWQTS